MADSAVEAKQFARQAGADLVGVAPMERFDDLPPEQSPRSISPDASSVIVVGRRITRGTLRGLEEGTNFGLYEQFGYSWLDGQFLALTTFETVEFLEDRGWEATPLFPFPPEAYPQGIAVRQDAPAPNVYPDVEYAAVAAGLAEMGYCRVALTPEFGHRQRWQMILTDAPLDPDPMLEEDICEVCRACAEICPLGAIDTERETTLTIAGREFTVAEVDFAKCRVCRNGARPNRYHPSGRPDRLGALCMRTCLQALEEAGKLTRAFHEPFRKREPWGLDALGELTQPLPRADREGRG
jgi:epoxyqueuosine reductase